ncbi:MAG: tRNA (N6-isopentenyl adenosine(37)-C2)-methylthiotransferase MiaB [Bdellovibrionaceae bacterium]|nr:tRNA (N6-isopentenyl adenosine(37)-C2)-methylthiotransferase MiaB [Pseudobdellovibrionaceae bacterium]
MTQCEIAAQNADLPLPESSKPLSELKAIRGVYISTYGCQMNVNDSERMLSLMEMVNFAPVDKPEEATVIIINACSVREKPVQKVYSEVGRYRKLKARNPELRIGVAGCVGQQEKENLIKNQPLIDFVFGTDNIDELPGLVRKLYETEAPTKIVEARFKHRDPYHVETLVRNPGVTTFVNIAKGCDNFCTFCIVPFTRGRERSRPLQHIVTDVRHLVRRGVKEVTLLGQNVNSYHDDSADFADLLAEVAVQTDVDRIRYTTSHPKDFNQKLVDVMATHSAKICDGIHLPFQSGSTRVLERMNRGYSREDYLEKIAMIRKSLPNAVFSTDIIVGFPGETEEDFQDTMSLVKEVGFETIFAFKYSPRPFTKAAKFEDQIDDATGSDRLARLFAMHEEMAFALNKKYENQVLPVLVEKHENGRSTGRSTQNKLVHFAGIPEDIGRIVPVRIQKAFPFAFTGERVLIHPETAVLS